MTDREKRTRRRRTPGLLLHKRTGQARVILNGKTIYLGLFGSPEAHERYASLIRKWEAGERKPLDPAPLAGSTRLTVSDLVAAYLIFLERTGRYMKRGKETTQRGIIRAALAELELSMGKLEVRKVTKAMLVHHRDRLEAGEFLHCKKVNHELQPLTRKGINRKLGLVKQLFAWGEERGMVPGSVAGSVLSLRSLKRDQLPASRNTKPKEPVADEVVEAIMPHLSRQVEAMVRLQQLTGMRPGEVCAMRWADIDTTPVVADGVACWTYRVRAPKTDRFEHETRYPLNPACQSILADFRKPPVAFIKSTLGNLTGQARSVWITVYQL